MIYQALEPTTRVDTPNQTKIEHQAFVSSASIIGKSSITAEKIDSVLKEYNSPAVGIGETLIALGNKYNIRAEVALAFFIHESSAGTKGIAVTTKSIGNIRQTPDSGFAQYQGFRLYSSWEVGAEDWFKLIKNTYVTSWKLTTIDQVIPRYAPAVDNNDESTYINHVKLLISSWM